MSHGTPSTPCGAAPHGDGSAVSDGSLVRRFRQGSEEAADRLYRRYASRLRALARARVSANLTRRVDPDDIVQSVFRRFFTAARGGEYDVPAGDDLWGLLLVITLNKVRTEEVYHRAARRDIARTVTAGAGDSPLARVAARGDAADAVLRLTVAEALGRLPDDHRRAAQLRLEGYDVAETAERMGRSRRTVERLLQEARAKLGRLLTQDDER